MLPLPQPKSALERVGVGPRRTLRGSLSILSAFPATKHDVIWLQRGEQTLQDVIDVACHFFLPTRLRAAAPTIGRTSFRCGTAGGQLHRL